jgi:alpha-amylase
MIRFGHVRTLNFRLVTVLSVLMLFPVPSAEAGPSRKNGVMMQYFHWYSAGYSAGQGLWDEVARAAPVLASKGITAVWLPPAYKGASGVKDVGYGVYDRYDLGEFDQKGSIPTKYGTRQKYQAAIAALHRENIDVYGDVVLNHMLGGDAQEKFRAVEVYGNNRNAEIPGTERVIGAATSYTFPGRGGRYSSFTWNWQHFTGSDFDRILQKGGIYKYRGPFSGWQEEVDHENGNYDYLLGNDLDMRHPEVRRELLNWGKWYVDQLQLDGLRLDAVKHLPFRFVADWLDHLRAIIRKKDLFAVGEYWSYEVSRLKHYLEVTGGRLSLFDAPLHLNFHLASKQNGAYDLRKIFDNTMVQADPTHAVTLVDNHDTQPLQSLQSPVADWFKPMAYALILLREQGYPCIFYADYFGATDTDKGQTIRMTSFQRYLDRFLYARYKYAYGPQHDSFDHWNVVGWTRDGDAEHPGGMAVLVNDDRASGGTKRMCFGGRAGLDRVRTYRDFLGGVTTPVTLDSQGCGIFAVKPASVAVWLPE